MTCRQRVSRTDEWQSTVMRTASDLVGRLRLSSSPFAPSVLKLPSFGQPHPPREWRSGTMRMLDAAVTPGTTANVTVSLAVTTILIPRIPGRALAVVAGFAAGSILRG